MYSNQTHTLYRKAYQKLDRCGVGVKLCVTTERAIQQAYNNICVKAADSVAAGM